MSSLPYAFTLVRSDHAHFPLMLAHQHFANSGCPDISVNVVTMNSRAIFSLKTSSHVHIGTKVGLFHNLSLFFEFVFDI
jgi:hypothetical protein